MAVGATAVLFAIGHCGRALGLLALAAAIAAHPIVHWHWRGKRR